MEPSKKKLLYAILDLVLLCLVGLVLLALYLFAHPFHRGFFCDDDSIRYPYHTSTISGLTVSLVSSLVPLAVIIMVECVNDRNRTPSSAGFCWKTLFTSGHLRWLKMAVIFLFGFATVVLMFMIGKYSSGRLRPHFMAVCVPDVACNSTSLDVIHRYITEYNCLNPDLSAVQESRMSFPSGHAATAFYGAVFLMMYIQYALPECGSKLVRHVIQLVMFSAAWFTALSRVFDYHHFWGDVLVGGIIGTLVAALMILVVSDARRYYNKPRKQDAENLENK